MNTTANRAALRCIRNVLGKRNMSGGHSSITPREACIRHKMTVDDLPAPLGKYAEVYSKKQTKYNMHLIASVAACVAFMFLAVKQQVWLFPDKTSAIDISQYYNPERDTRFLENNVYLEVVEKED